MKTIEEKAKAYDEALEVAKRKLCMDEAGMVDNFTPDDIRELFPELAESEDEKIRKFIVDCIEELRRVNQDNSHFNGVCSDAIAWLEKIGDWHKMYDKPAEWREEDEDKIMLIEDSFSDYLDYVREDNSLTKHQKNTTKDNVVGYVNWLKSLRPQKHSNEEGNVKNWKPSEEQIMAVEAAWREETLSSDETKELGTLLKQLKALYDRQRTPRT